MSAIINQPLYEPVGSTPFSQIKPFAPPDDASATDLWNAELQAISDAFQQLWALPIVTADSYLTANVRNALVDLSGLADTDTGIAIYLPQNPSVGDPSCIVIVQESGYQTLGSPHFEAVAIITTNDGTYVNGLAQSLDNHDQVTLYNPGDVAICTFVGGSVGWSVRTNQSIATNPNIGFQLPAIGQMPSPRMEYVLNSPGVSYNLGQLYPTAQAGQWFAITKNSNDVTLTETTYTFNGVAGPYVVNQNYKRYLFVAQGNSEFTVTIE